MGRAQELNARLLHAKRGLRAEIIKVIKDAKKKKVTVVILVRWPHMMGAAHELKQKIFPERKPNPDKEAKKNGKPRKPKVRVEGWSYQAEKNCVVVDLEDLLGAIVLPTRRP